MERLVIITGLSGSGKSLAAQAFEDLGYFCVDNLPVALIPRFYELIQRSAEQIPRAALVVDIREKDFLGHVPEALKELRNLGAPVKVTFFECDDEILKRRFSTTRRPHPMAATSGSLEQAIHDERKALAALRAEADRIIDTSRFTAHELRAFLKNAYGDQEATRGPNINVMSFGFKYGLPSEADLVFDVRFLPNPYFVEDLRPLNGRNEPVQEFLESKPETHEFLGRLKTFLDFLMPLYAAEGKTYLTIAVGCTGGKHRSVMLAERLLEHFSQTDRPVSVSHRDLGKE